MPRLTALARTAWPLAIGAAAGLAAWKGRELARRAAEAATGDWSDMLIAAQLEIGEDLERLLAVPATRPRRRRRLAERLARRVDRYLFQAEAAAYPALLRLDPQTARPLVEGLTAIRAAVADLRETAPDAPDWSARVRALGELLERQAVAEAEALVPALHQLPAEAYRRLTRRTAEAAVRLA